MAADPTTLNAVASELQRWLEWHQRYREDASLPTDDETRIARFPGFIGPTRGTLKGWVAALTSPRADTAVPASPASLVEPALTDEQCDKAAAQAMDEVAAAKRLHALEINPDITAHHTLRRALIRAGAALAAPPAGPDTDVPLKMALDALTAMRHRAEAAEAALAQSKDHQAASQGQAAAARAADDEPEDGRLLTAAREVVSWSVPPRECGGNYTVPADRWLALQAEVMERLRALAASPQQESGHQAGALRHGAVTPSAGGSDDAPKCRDCADFGPICPNSGLPCGAAGDRA